MLIGLLNDLDQKIIYKVLKASVDGPFFPEWEFHTLIGIERGELLRLLDNWPKFTQADESALLLAINNCFANLLGYPHGQQEALKNMLSVEIEELIDLFKKIKFLQGKEKS